MLAGHYAPALFLKQKAPEVPLWALFLAVQAVDIGYMVLALLDIETATIDNERAPRFIVGVAPWTHSLLMTLVYGALCLAIGAAAKRTRLGVVFAFAVMSHWVADVIVHVPDLPLGLSGTPTVGLGLWKIPLLATALECVLVVWTAGRFRAVAAALVVLQFANDLILPMDTDLHLVALKALGLYFGVAGFAWWSERRINASTLERT